MTDLYTHSSFLKTREWHELLDGGLDVGVELVVKGSLSSDIVEDGLMLSSKVVKITLLEGTNIVGWNFIEISLNTSVQNAHLLFSWHWNVLLLLQEFGKFLSSVQKLLSGGIKIGTELGEGSDFSVLGELKLHGSGNLLHCFNLGSGSDSRHGKTDVNCWSDTSVEQFSF